MYSDLVKKVLSVQGNLCQVPDKKNSVCCKKKEWSFSLGWLGKMYFIELGPDRKVSIKMERKWGLSKSSFSDFVISVMPFHPEHDLETSPFWHLDKYKIFISPSIFPGSSRLSYFPCSYDSYFPSSISVDSIITVQLSSLNLLQSGIMYT